MLMKKEFFTTVIALMICSATASAQYSDTATAQYKQHSIEITTGYPSIIHFFEYPFIGESIEMQKCGRRYKEHYQPELNVGYTFQWAKRWEVNALLNAHLTIMDVYQYPLLPEYADRTPSETNSSQYYDWNADPVSKTRQTKVYGAFCASLRFKWLDRESFSMYSALGVGTSFAVPFPLPYLAPIGIQFGKGKVFGIVEANISAATTFGMAGIGIRL